MATELERTQKREEILVVARSLFEEHGYDATSMGRIAKSVGVAPNTIYWYFADKDALLIAVLDALVAEAVDEYQGKRSRAALDVQVLWLLEVLKRAETLIGTVHARVSSSPQVHAWHERFHVMFEAMLVAALREHGVEAGQQRSAARVAMFVVEGLLAHPTSKAERKRLVRWMVSALGAGATGKASH